MTPLPSDLLILEAARNALSNARDWLNSDTTDTIAGRRSAETARIIALAAQKIAVAEAAIDAAKDAALRSAER